MNKARKLVLRCLYDGQVRSSITTYIFLILMTYDGTHN